MFFAIMRSRSAFIFAVVIPVRSERLPTISSPNGITVGRNNLAEGAFNGLTSYCFILLVSTYCCRFIAAYLACDCIFSSNTRLTSESRFCAAFLAAIRAASMFECVPSILLIEPICLCAGYFDGSPHLPSAHSARTPVPFLIGYLELVLPVCKISFLETSLAMAIPTDKSFTGST